MPLSAVGTRCVFLSASIERTSSKIPSGRFAEIADDEPLAYDDLNSVRADGCILQGLIALGLVDDATAARWHLRMARFMDALAAAMPDDPTTKVGDVLTESFLQMMWDATAKEVS